MFYAKYKSIKDIKFIKFQKQLYVKSCRNKSFLCCKGQANIDGIDGLGREYHLFLAVEKLCGGLADYAVLAHRMA